MVHKGIIGLSYGFYAACKAKPIVDIPFTMGPEEEEGKVPGPQLLLNLSSEVFRTKFLDNWETMEGEEEVTTFPLISPDFKGGFNTFLRGIHLFEIKPKSWLVVLKDAILLTHEYMVRHILRICEDNVQVTVYNCHGLLEMEKVEEISKVLWDRTWTCFIRNLPHLLGETTPPEGVPPTSDDPSPSPSTNWGVGTWKMVLELEGGEMKGIKEETLFRGLIGWMQLCPSSREPLFKSLLLPLIRFPLMDLDFIVKVVLPLNILTDKDVTDLVCHCYEGLKPNGRTLGFNSKPRYQERLMDLLYRQLPRFY